MRQGIALRSFAALAVLSAAVSLHAQCTPIVRSVSQPGMFPNLAAGPIATNGSIVGLAKSDGTRSLPAIHFQLFDANLNSTTVDRQIASSSAGGPVALFFADAVSAIATPPPNEFGLFYQRPDATLMLQRIDATGNPLVSPIAMPHTWTLNDDFDIAWDHSAGAYAIAHLVTGGIDQGLWLTMVSPTGSVISDLNISVIVNVPSNARLAILPDGSVALLWTNPNPSNFITIVKNGVVVRTTEIAEQQVSTARIATNGSSILVIYSSPTGAGSVLRYVALNTSGTVSTADSFLMRGSGVDIAPLSLQWNPSLSEWALVYADASLGFNLFPADTRLRRFAAVGGTTSDTFLSPDPIHSRLFAPFPLLFLGNGYVGSIARTLSTVEGSESYLVRLCPLIAAISIDRPLARPFDLVTFTASSNGGTSPYTYSWQFGDDGVASGAVVQHRYSVVGTYTVTLTATDTAGAISIVKSTVVITDKVRGRAARH